MLENGAEPKHEQVELETDRLQLRGAIADDAKYLFDTFRDPEAMRYWSELPHKSVERTREWVSSMINNKQNGVTDFIICSKAADNKPIGKIGIWSGDEIGFILNRSHWHRGLAIEAMSKVLPYFFDVRKLESISSDTDPRNQASIGLLKRFGFEEERYEENTFQIGEEWVHSLYMRLTKERWIEQNAS